MSSPETRRGPGGEPGPRKTAYVGGRASTTIVTRQFAKHLYHLGDATRGPRLVMDPTAVTLFREVQDCIVALEYDNFALVSEVAELRRLVDELRGEAK